MLYKRQLIEKHVCFSGREMKLKSKTLWTFLVTALLMAILLMTKPILAQLRTDLSLTLLPSSYYREIKAGKDNIFYLEIRNTGDTTITNIKLSSDKPENWVIDFNPENMGSLSPDSLQIVDVNIKPPGSASNSEQRINLIATANEIRRVESLFVTVETASVWLWIGIAVVVVVIAVFVFIFIRFDREK